VIIDIPVVQMVLAVAPGKRGGVPEHPRGRRVRPLWSGECGSRRNPPVAV